MSHKLGTHEQKINCLFVCFLFCSFFFFLQTFLCEVVTTFGTLPNRPKNRVQRNRIRRKSGSDSNYPRNLGDGKWGESVDKYKRKGEGRQIDKVREKEMKMLWRWAFPGWKTTPKVQLISWPKKPLTVLQFPLGELMSSTCRDQMHRELSRTGG